MRRIILILLLLFSHMVYGQLSDDSLKKLCIDQYAQLREVNRKKWGSKYIDGHVTDSVKELFPGYFKDLRIFSVEHCTLSFVDTNGREYIIDHMGGCYPKTYFLNAYTGKSIGAMNYRAFNELVNTASKKITNIDKCYLFLYINNFERDGLNLTEPDRYKPLIRNNSIFLAEERWAFDHYGAGTLYTSSPYDQAYLQIMESIEESTNKQIYMYVRKNVYTGVGGRDTAYGYRFNFDNDTLKKVTQLEFKLPK